MVKSYKFFLSIIAFFTLANLLVMNDVATIWSGAEANNFILAEVLGRAKSFAQWVIGGFGKISDFHPFGMRLSGVLIFLLGGLGVYGFGRKVFGTPTIISALLIGASSLALVNLAKIATADIWTATFHTLVILTQIRYLKQPKIKWQIWHLVFLTIATIATPNETFFVVFLFSMFLYTMHPQGKRVIKLYQWIIVPLIMFVPSYITGFSHQMVDSYFIKAAHLTPFFAFYWIILFGSLPWIGFVVAGLYQNTGRLRKKEEFAILMTAWLIVALLFKSFSILWLFAILAAKQLENYQLPNFPKVNENIIKTFSLLNLVVAFCGAIYLMLNMFYVFEAPGFRAAMLIGAVYWMPLIFGVIGLYGKNDKLIRAGFATGGVLVTLLFWLQLYPYIESQRNLPQRVTLAAIELESSVYVSGNTDFKSNLWYYLMRSKEIDQPIAIENKLLEIYQKRDGRILVLNQTDYDVLVKANPELKAEEIKGWTEAGREESYWIVK